MIVRKKVVLLIVCVTTLVILISLATSSSYLVLGWRVERLERENNYLIQELQIELQMGEQKWIDNKQNGSNLESNCETIHIALVVVGCSTIRSLITLTKSILFYRHNTLHFHFVTDDKGRFTIQNIFMTWKLPAVKISFYPVTLAEELVAWIPNSHYSGVYGLMKLTLPSLLPNSLQKVIVIDTDVMLMSDILSLWKYFGSVFAHGKLIGLVENQSDWYLGNLWEGHKPWPAVGRGFNTGVMLFNLQKMRDSNWKDLWSTITTRALLEYQSTTLADQDIINKIILDEQHLHYVLPCFWNAQLSEHSLSDYCYYNANDFKLIHWNSPVKQTIKNRFNPYFKSMYDLFKNQDGYNYRKALLNCNEISKVDTYVENLVEAATTDPCLEFQKIQNTVFRTHLFAVDFDYKPSLYDVTLVTQMSMDRLYMLAPLYTHWTGPISVAMYATDSQITDVLEYVSSFLVHRSKRLALHLFFKVNSLLYPINQLRNVALQNVNTPYVFLSDIDFLPMNGAYEYLLEAIKVLGKPKRLLVVPAFETQQYKVVYPRDKDELLKMLKNKTVATFRSREWQRGHASTNYKHWKQTVKPYKIKWSTDFEPYIVSQSNVSTYDERFSGFGWNKVSHIMKLNALGYEFIVLPSVFVIHMPHSPSLDVEYFRKNTAYRDCVRIIKNEFKAELDGQNYTI